MTAVLTRSDRQITESTREVTFGSGTRTAVVESNAQIVEIFFTGYEGLPNENLRFRARIRVAHYIQIALQADLVQEAGRDLEACTYYQRRILHGLAPMPGKASDSRARAFTAVHGRLVQVELDALDPVDLRALFSTAIGRWWDPVAHAAVLAAEQDDLHRLQRPP